MTRIAIIGAGIAGTTAAHWLIKSNPHVHITLFDAKDPLAASRGQTLLVHPFPGRSLAPHPLLGEAVTALRSFLTEWQIHFPDLIRDCEMWRPMKGSNAQRLLHSWQNWWQPAGKHYANNPWTRHPPIIHPVPEQVLLDTPSHQTPYNTLSTTPAYMIDAQELFPAIHNTMKQTSVSVVHDVISHISSVSSHWQLRGNLSDQYGLFDQVVLALGQGSQSWFPHLQLAFQGGSLLRIRPENTQRIPALSLDGLHVGQHHTGDWVIGSTRWSSAPADPQPEIDALLMKLKQTLPHAPQMVNDSANIWSGVRTIYSPDRMPLCGPLPQHRNIFCITALGSKGWLWGPWAAQQTVATMNDSTHSIPTCIDLMRANMEDGWYSPNID